MPRCAICRAAYRKGIGLTFPNQDVDIVWQHKRNRRRRRGAREEFSFLFNGGQALESVYPEIGRFGRESPARFAGSGASATALENPVESVFGRIRTPGRTHNRIRSPRLAASGR